MPNLRGKTWTTSTPANVEDAQYWEDHLISDTAASKAASSVQSVNNTTPDAQGNVDIVALPDGGTIGQVLTKQSSVDGDADWEDPASSGHTIEDEDGNTMPYQETLQFENAEVTNDPANNKTIVDCKGSKGDAATITVGTVTTLPAGSDATVTNSGTSSDAVFDFGIPKGADGAGAVDSVNGYTGVVVLDASDVGALPDSTTIPTKTSELDNDSGFVTANDVPTSLSELSDDATHRLVTDAEKTDWDAKVSESLLKSTVGWTGKNLLCNKLGDTANHGVTYKLNTDGSVTINGTADSTSVYCFNRPDNNINIYTDIFIKQGTTVIASAGVQDTNRNLLVRYTDGTWGNMGKDVPFTCPKDVGIVYMQVLSGTTVDNITIYPMLRDASITDDTYEPYHESVEQTLRDAEVIEGKNLLENNAISKTVNGVTFTVNSDKSITANGTATAETTLWLVGDGWNYSNCKDIPLSIEDNTEYIFGGKTDDSSDAYMQLVIKNSDGTNPTYWVSYGTHKKVSTSVINRASQKWHCWIRINNGTTVTNKTFYPMIAKESGTYEPYYIPLKDSKFDRAEQRVLGAKNLLKYPYYDTTKTSNGITFTDNKDGSITVNGTATADVSFYVQMNTFLNEICKKGDLVITGGTATARLILGKSSASGGGYIIDNGSGADIPQNTTFVENFVIKVNNGATVSNVTIYPMLRLASDPDDTYVPYAMTNRELTEEKLSISELKTIASSAADFAAFKTAIANL